jgi:hypothetical protein
VVAKNTITALFGVLGGLTAILGIPALFARRPTYGPRLQPGELKAGEASAQAEKNYWEAEQAAARGQCSQATRSWQKARAYHHMAKQRAAKGDRTGRDLRESIREAREEIRRCRSGPLS